MNILYLDCHAILSYDEIKLFTELGHDVFSMGGSYFNPTSPADPKRPAINAKVQQQLMDVANQCSKDDIHQELIDWADVIYVQHIGKWIISNWKNISKKIVIWRTIGQSVPQTEGELAIFRTNGLRVVRYSPAEMDIKGYIGHDAIIRFYKDENEFKDWNGNKDTVITVAQSMKKRGFFCGYELFDKVTSGLPRSIYGPGNEDIEYWGGLLSYEELIKTYQDNRVYMYTGTYPASYTLNFIEAFMTGIPMVCIGEALADVHLYDIHAYEIPQIIKNGENGFISDDVGELRQHIETLKSSHEYAQQIGQKGRETAIAMFGKEVIKKQWQEYFDSL